MVELMAYEGNTNTSSYVVAGLAGSNAFLSNLQGTKSTDFTKLSKGIADARALQQKALNQGKYEKDVAKMKADTLRKKGETILKNAEDSKPRMAGKLAAFALNGAGGYLVGAELKKEMNRKSDTSYYERKRAEAEGKILPTDDASIESYVDGMLNQSNTGTVNAESSGGSGKKDSGGIVEPVTGATVKTGPTIAFGDTPAGKYGKNWYGLSSVIRFAEGTNKPNGYTTMFGHRQFTDMSKHPNSPAPTPWGTQSEAAGAYQFMKPTWGDVERATGVKDFSPESQEIGARWLTQRAKVNPDQLFTTRAELKGAVDKIALTWAGLPYSGKGLNGGGYGTSYYGQGGKSFDQIVDVYQKAMGVTLK